jgi:hypothetical protein
MIEGANSSVYGNYALGGVINIVTAPPEGRTIKVRTSIAGRATHKIDFFGANAWDKFAVAAEAQGSVPMVSSWFLSWKSGVPLPWQSMPCESDYQNANLKIDFSPDGSHHRICARRVLSEDRIMPKARRPSASSFLRN